MSEPLPTEQADYLMQVETSSDPLTESTTPPADNDFIRNKVEQMAKESAQLQTMQDDIDKETPAEKERKDIDSRSIFISNVDFSVTPVELQEQFASCGVVKRVTILTNKFTGQPKGYAYLEFEEGESVGRAIDQFDGSVFRERELKVTMKRTNVPGFGGGHRGRGGGRGGRGGFGRGRGRSGFRGGFRGGRGGAPRFNPY